MGGWMDRWVNGWMDGQMDEWVESDPAKSRAYRGGKLERYLLNFCFTHLLAARNIHF